MPRDEVVTAIDKPDDHKGTDEDLVLDLNLLTPDDISEIDTGVTSGADSSDWDPINIDEEKANKCAGAGSASASTKGSPAACGVKQKS